MSLSDDKYLDDGYIDDGYFFTPRILALIYGSNRVDLRCPSSRSGTVRLLQPEEYTTGWAHIGFPPLGSVHTLSLDYQRFSGEERTALESFWDTVDASAVQWTYRNANIGAASDVPVWFERTELSFEQPGYDVYRVSLGLWAQSTFFPLAGAAPTINDADTILTRLHNPATHARAKKQPMLRMSDNTVRIYNKSSITRKTRTITMLRRTAAEMGNLVSFFTTAAAGVRNTFSWTFEGSGHTVRFASPSFSWRQSQANTALFDVTLSLEEDT